MIFSLNYGGSETMLVDIINEQCKENNVVLIIVNDRISVNLLGSISNKVKIYQLNRKEGTYNPFPISRLNVLLLKENPQIIHCHNHQLVNVCFFKKSITLTVHATDIPAKNLKKYHKVFAISKSVQRYISQISGINSVIVYNGINISAVNKKPDNPKVNSERRISLIQVGRLDHKVKGQHLSIMAFKLLKERGYKVRLGFIGEGASRIFLEQLVIENELQDDIQFLNIQDRDYLYKNLCNYDILLQPSLIEGFGLTIIEAIAAQLQIVVSDTEGPKEITDFLNYGMCFRTGDYVDLANAIEKVIINPQLITNEILDKLVNNFDVKQTAKKYVEEYHKLLN